MSTTTAKMEDAAFDRAYAADQDALRKVYDKYADIRRLVVDDLKNNVEQVLVSFHSSPTVNSRIKKFESYYRKYLHLLKNGNENPLITDILGIRIICPFIEDLKAVENLIRKNFEVREKEIKSHSTFKEFGYESIHLLIVIPEEIIAKRGNPETNIAEIQIRTILQEAWAEVEHELIYKAEFNPFDKLMKRKLAAVNASLSLADIIFHGIRSYQRRLSGELGERRKSFFRKIEEATDDFL
ncbi:MAG: (p)ppGpp synthetase, partial [Treponema sp.]|nr:(p)ppGpp synthetase [Treponema sp.]